MADSKTASSTSIETVNSSLGQHIAWLPLSATAERPNRHLQPWDVAVSPDGRWVYVADTWNHRILKFSPEGKLAKVWGHAYYGQDDPLGIWGPRGIAVDALGRVYVSDTGNKRIVIFDADGNYLAQSGSPGLQPGQFDEPVGLAFDEHSNLYVADTWNQRVQVFIRAGDDLTFTPLTQWDIAGWYGQSLDNKPYIAVDRQGHVFITDRMARILNSPLRAVRAVGQHRYRKRQPADIAMTPGRVWVKVRATTRSCSIPLQPPVTPVPTTGKSLRLVDWTIAVIKTF